MKTVESNYVPNKPACQLHASSARIIVCVGGLGSGKSYSVIKEVEQSAMQWPNMPIGIYRKTLPALRDSTLEEFKRHSDPDLGAYKYREDRHEYINNSYVNFRGLDSPTKVKSTNYALVVMEEAEEFTEEDFRRLNERVRATGPWPLRLIIVLNPVDEDHWIYKQFVDNAKEWQDNGGLEVIHFSTLDNLANLPPGYVEQVTVGMSPDEIDRYIHGKWGTIVKGKSVFSTCLNPNVHLRKVENYPGMTLIRGWDFGFNHPAVSFRHVDIHGRMNTKFEIMGDKEDLPVFVPRVIAATQKMFPIDAKIFDFGDPRGHDKAQNGKGSCFETLQEFGINAKGERGVRDYVEEGIRQMIKEFSTLIDGVPKHTIDPLCSIHRAGFFGRYVRDEDGRPKKDGFYEHMMDASRYISHHHKHQDAVLQAMTHSKLTRVTRLASRNPYTGYGRR